MGTIPDRIFELIVLQLDHEQTADEEKELAAWLAEKKEHRQWWESYLQIRAQAKLLDRPFSADTEKALARLPGVFSGEVKKLSLGLLSWLCLCVWDYGCFCRQCLGRKIGYSARWPVPEKKKLF